MDFIQPEFLNILFFQQKNLVIFPYVDLKHLHSLETFSVGFNIVDLESTALHNIKEIIEFESSNGYSQNPSLYLIYNLDKDKVKQIMNIDSLRFILNSNDKLQDLVNGENFVFYNKKTKTFLNYEEGDLEFEKELINSSKNLTILQDKIQEIKSKATQIFTEINDGNEKAIPEILSAYEYKHWGKILQFVDKYFDTPAVPRVEDLKPVAQDVKEEPIKKKLVLDTYEHEYHLIKRCNRAIAGEFIQLLNEYRTKFVNQSNLELDQIYDPQKTYDYLRNHHWSRGIPDEFAREWIQMKITGHTLKASDYEDFELVFQKLGIDEDLFLNIFATSEGEDKQEDQEDEDNSLTIPSVENWSDFKSWMIGTMNDIEKELEKRKK